MTISPFDSVRDIPLDNDSDLVDRLSAMLDGAMRRQVWLMFLDENAHQLPVVLPSEVPARPGRNDATALARVFRDLGAELEADAVVATYERRGRAGITDADRIWLRCLRDACLASGLNFRGPFLCHNDGVVHVAPDDYLK